MPFKLQSTFSYGDDVPPPIDYVRVGLTFPRFAVHTDDTEASSLSEVGTEWMVFSHEILSKQYSASVYLDQVFGSEFGSALAAYLGTILASGRKPALRNLSTHFDFDFEEHKEGEMEINAIFFANDLRYWASDLHGELNSGRPSDSLTSAESFSGNGPSSSSQSQTEAVFVQQPTLTAFSSPAPGRIIEWIQSENINDTVDKAMYIVNKDEYFLLLNEIFPSIGSEDWSILLYLINPLVDLTGTSPALMLGVEDVQRETFDNQILEFGLSPNPEAFDTVISNFTKLFDFPLHLQKIDLFSLAGTVTVLAPPPMQISASQASLYHLSAEYTVDPGYNSEDYPSLHIGRYQWTPEMAPQNNVINFLFTENIARSRVMDTVLVKLKAFDGSTMYEAKFSANDPLLQQLKITVDLRLPSRLGNSDDSATPGGSGRKIPGKLVSLSDRCSLKAVVVIQTKVLSKDSHWLTVSSTMSDEQGNFALPYPYGKYEIGQVLVSIDPGHSTSLTMDPDAQSSVPSSFMYILLNDPIPADPTEQDTAKKDGCSCDETTRAGRLPGNDDLINNSQYMQDLGGGCINLLTPNRTLREYNYSALVRSSDPDVANYTLSSWTNPDDLSVSYQLTRGGKISRSLIDLDNPVQWQDVSEVQSDSVLYQAVTVATGHVLYYKSEFRSDGYSLGSLLYSLPLAPGQRKEVVTIEARHSLRGSESQRVAQSEELAHSLVNSRDIVDSIAGNIGENLNGSSSSNAEGVSAGVGISGSVGFLGGSLGVAGGYSSSSSSASQNSSRNLGSHFSEMLRQGTIQNSSSYRAMNSTVVTSVNEGMSESVQSSVVANHNHCHSMTMMYFEVLEHFAVFQELVDVEECIFVPFLMTKFTMENIYKWADVLVTRLLRLHSNTYLKPATFFSNQPTHPLIPSFDALERVKTNWALVDYPLTTYDDEVIESIQGTMTLNVNIARPNTKYDFIKSLPIITKQVSSTSTNVGDVIKYTTLNVLSGGLSSIFGGSSPSHTTTTTIQTRAQIFDAFMQLDANYQSVPPASCIRVVNFNPFPLSSLFGASDDGTDPVIDPTEFFFGATVDRTMWIAYAAILGYDNSSSGAITMLTYYFKGQLISEWNNIWSTSIAPLIFIKMSESLAIQSADAIFTPLGRYTGGERQMTVSFTGTLHLKRNQISSLTVFSKSANVQALHGSTTVFILGNTRIAYSTPHYNGLLFSGYPNEDLTNPFAILFTPETAAEKRNPRADDKYLASRLIVHLNQNLEYYNRVLWLSLDPQRRFLLLDGFNLEVFDQQGVSVGFRSISSIVKSSLLGVAGNSLVFPVAPGYKVSQNYVYVTDSEGAEVAESLLDFYKPDNPTPPYRLSVPTKGVYSEALMGACDSCEVVKADSSQDWTKFTTDDAPAINATEPALPNFTQYNPVVKDLAAPAITIQNAPAAPDPGIGLSTVAALLGKSDLFENITGLDGTQKAALQTLLSNNASAKEFASMAGGLAQQGHNTANSEQILDTMAKAKQTGALTQEDYNGLVKSHFQQQIDGGTTLKANIDAKKASAKPTITDAAVLAASNGQEVTATTTDGSGASESLQLGGLGGGGVIKPTLAQVKPEPFPIKQPNSSVCWATALAMMLQWKKNASITPRDAVATSSDPQWLKLYDTPSVLPFSKLAEFYKAYGLVAEPPQSVGPQVYVDLIKKYGPLWVNVDSDPTGAVSGHAKILIRITGDASYAQTNFVTIDPWFGAVTTETFLQFVTSIEQLAEDPNMITGFQVLHFKDQVPPI